MIRMPISDIDMMTAKSRSDLMGVLASSRTQGKGIWQDSSERP